MSKQNYKEKWKKKLKGKLNRVHIKAWDVNCIFVLYFWLDISNVHVQLTFKLVFYYYYYYFLGSCGWLINILNMIMKSICYCQDKWNFIGINLLYYEFWVIYDYALIYMITFEFQMGETQLRLESQYTL